MERSKNQKVEEEHLAGNYGTYCQRECHMKILSK